MSAPMQLHAAQLRQLAEFLDGLGALVKQTGVRPDAYGSLSVSIGGVVVEVAQQGEDGPWRLDDRIGR